MSGATAKSLRRRLQRQLEFYLSASNLRQDKFLQQHMDEDGFLPASLFLSFNKIKALRATEKLVLEAAAKSEALRVDEAHAAIAPSAAALQGAQAAADGALDLLRRYLMGVLTIGARPNHLCGGLRRGRPRPRLAAQGLRGVWQGEERCCCV
jgi:hypothetical protein